MKYVDFYRTDFGRKVLEIEARYISNKISGNRILSIGCGPGIIEERIMHLTNADIICADISLDMLLSFRCKVEKILCRAEHLPFKNNSFDGIIMITSLEFIENVDASLDEARRVLKPGKGIIFLILNPSSNYFKEKLRRKDSYISRNIKHPRLEYLLESISKRFKTVNKEYIVSVRGKEISERGDKGTSAILAVEACKC